jgi:hypothetical protein
MDSDNRRPHSTGNDESVKRGASDAEALRKPANRLSVAEVSHELGNLLTVISGWAQYWEETAAPASVEPPAARYIYVAVGRIRYCLDCVVDCGGTVRKHLAVTNVNTMVKSIAAGLDPRVRANYKLQTAEEAEPWPVIADYWALDIVFVNLLMNIVALVEPGSSIFITTANVETVERSCGIDGSLAEGRYVRVSVAYERDDVETQPLWSFLPLAGAKPVSPAAEGLFPLSLRILEEHGALLRAEDSPDGQSTVSVFLPALRPRGHIAGPEGTSEEE